MKRIIDGVTYNTATSTMVARSWWRDPKRQQQMQGELYLTRAGAFFAAVTEAGSEGSRHGIEPMNRDKVEKWLSTEEVELFDTSIVHEPPEAADEPEATLYIRVPRTLRDRLAANAEEEDVSLNTYVMRCVERSLKTEAVAEALWRAHYIGLSIEAVPDRYSEERRLKAIGAMRKEIEHVWRRLGLPRKKGHDIGEDIMLYRELETLQEWQPYLDYERTGTVVENQNRRGEVT